MSSYTAIYQFEFRPSFLGSRRKIRPPPDNSGKFKAISFLNGFHQGKSRSLHSKVYRLYLTLPRLSRTSTQKRFLSNNCQMKRRFCVRLTRFLKRARLVDTCILALGNNFSDISLVSRIYPLEALNSDRSLGTANKIVDKSAIDFDSTSNAGDGVQANR